MNYPSKEEYLLERILRDVTAYPLNRTVYVLPGGEYTERLIQSLRREGFQAELLEKGQTNGHNRQQLVDVESFLNRRRFPLSLPQLVKETKEYAVSRGKNVRIIPSEQTALLTAALEREGILYYVALPSSPWDYQQEYQIDLLEIEIVEER